MGSLVLTQGQSSLTLSTTMSPKIQILTSIAFCLSCLLTGTGATLQPEPEEVSLSGVYGFFTNELVIRKFYVVLILQGIASSLFWLGLAQLGNPSSKRRSSDTEQSRLASQGWLPHDDLKRQGEEREEISLTEDVLPSLLARNSVLQQILINTVLTSSFLTFWGVMDLLA